MIPDSHAEVNDKNLDRFTWVGKLIVDEQPDIVIDIGDRADLPSLSSYDKGTKSFEGRRYNLDLKTVKEANRLLLEPLKKLQKKQRKNRKKIYNPELIITLGNHEQRIQRVTNASPELSEVISYNDLGYDKDWTVYDFLEVIERGGIKFSHYFASGLMGKPIGGVNSARSHIGKLYCSTVSGHSHLLDYAEDVDAVGNRIQALVVGCYVEDKPSWATQQQFQQWASGIVILDDVKDGTYNLRTISIDTMRSTYGK